MKPDGFTFGNLSNRLLAVTGDQWLDGLDAGLRHQRHGEHRAGREGGGRPGAGTMASGGDLGACLRSLANAVTTRNQIGACATHSVAQVWE
jgi:hypothetical protein